MQTKMERKVKIADYEEKQHLIMAALNLVGIPVDYITVDLIDRTLTKFAEKAGAHAALVVTPYYNKPTQEGLYQHYKAINNNCGIPIFIYNIPGRSVIDMSVDTMCRLFELKNIAGVKDATGDLKRVVQQRKKLGKNFIQFTGEDSNALEFKLRGGVGCISVTANVAPKLCSEMQTLLDYQSDKLLLQRAKEINKMLKPLHDLMFIETNPAPVKYAVSLLKLCSKDLRLPMVTIAKKNQIRIKNLLKNYKEELPKYDLLIYSPCVSAGVDINFKYYYYSYFSFKLNYR